MSSELTENELHKLEQLANDPVLGIQEQVQHLEEPTEATLYLGDETWHDGPGWYYVLDEYPDEGSCGAFATEAEAIAHAARDGIKATRSAFEENR